MSIADHDYVEMVEMVPGKNTLKDIETACTVLEKIKEFPNEPGFLAFFEKMAPQLGKVKDTLLKIDTIERLESRRDMLAIQRRRPEELLKSVNKNLFDPFKSIWDQDLKNGIKIIGKEISVIEPGVSKEISRPFTANAIGKAMVK